MNQMQEADEEADDYHGTHARLGLLWPLSGSNRLMKYRVKSRLTKQPLITIVRNYKNAWLNFPVV